jgi:hypothetical protein
MMGHYISTVLGLDTASKDNGAAELLLWAPDDAGKFQSTDDAENTGGLMDNVVLIDSIWVSGFATRKLLCSASAYVRVLMALPFAIGGTGLALPPNTRVRIGLTNASNDFRLITDVVNPSFKIQLADMKVGVGGLVCGGLIGDALLQVYADYLTPSMSLSTRLSARLSTAPLEYAYLRKYMTQPTTIPAGTQSATITLCSGPLPDLVLIVVQPELLTRVST